MTRVPLVMESDHLFLDLAGERWLLDTGAPSSFGRRGHVRVGGRSFAVGSTYMGLDAPGLSAAVGVDVAGLLGADVLNAFDLDLDLVTGVATLCEDELDLSAEALDLDEFMGIPILRVEVRGETHRVFFDTGAQISYLQSDVRTSFPEAGELEDFYPGFGTFQTPTHLVEARIGAHPETLRCGVLPGMLGMSLMMANTQGIVGLELLKGRRAVYAPRRRLLELADREAR